MSAEGMKSPLSEQEGTAATPALPVEPLAAVLQDELARMREHGETAETEMHAADLRAAIKVLR